jgi:hypothetical protein
MQLFASTMKLGPPHRFWLAIAVAMGGLSPMSARAGDFSDTAGAGIAMVMLFPFVLALLTLVAPQGTRLLVFGFALVGLPLLASFTSSFIHALPDAKAAKLWFISTATVTAAWLFVLIQKRFRRLAEGSWEFLWNPARLVAGILIFLSVQSALQLVFQSKAMGPLRAMGGLAFQIATIVIFVNMWQYRPWAWWTVLAITLAGIAVHIWQFPTLLLHAGGWLSQAPALLILALLLLPSTRRQCSRQEPDIAPSLH